MQNMVELLLLGTILIVLVVKKFITMFQFIIA